MGTDIYLDWKGKTKKEQEKQYTGWSIKAGDVGYLRASIGMTRENAFLRALFPDEYWNNETGKPIRYNFTEEKYKVLIKAGIAYLFTILAGKEVETIRSKERSEVGQKIFSLLQDTGIGEVVISASLDFRSTIIWINSVWNFFELGMEKESKSLEPKIYISW